MDVPDVPVYREYAIKEKEFPLKSGLRVIVQEDHSSPLVAVVAAYGVGSTSDPQGREGLAHVVEHMAFKSRPGGGDSSVMDRLKRMGANFNAFTMQDRTVYFSVVHKDNLTELLQLEAWRLARTVDGVTEDAFKTEREVVRNELRLDYETVFGPGFDKLLERLFPAPHPLHRSVIGSHESLTASSLGDVQTFVKAHYLPTNCVMVVSGDVKPDEVAKQLGRWPAELLFGPAGPSGSAVPPLARLGERKAPEVPPMPTDTALLRLKGPVLTPTLLIGWAAPPGFRGDDSLHEMTSNALNIALEVGIDFKDEDDIEEVGAFDNGLSDGSYFVIEARLKPGADPERARRRILDAVVNAWVDEHNRMLVNQGKWRAGTLTVLASAELQRKALDTAQYALGRGRSSLYKDALREIAGISPAGVGEFAFKWLRRERSASVFIEPEDERVGRSTGLVGTVGDTGKRGDHDLSRGGRVDLAAMNAEAVLKVARPPGIAQLPRSRLSNGTELVVVPRGEAPVATAVLSLRGGRATYAPYGLSDLADEFSYERCKEYPSLYPVGGTRWFVHSDMDHLIVANVLSGNLANALGSISDYVACRAVDEETFQELPRFLELAQKRYDRVAKKPQLKALRAFWAALYPDHPFGVINPPPSTLSGVTEAQVTGFLGSHYQPNSALLIVTGDVHAPEVTSMAEKFLASRWRGVGSGASAPAVTKRPEVRKVMVFPRAGATQSQVSVGCPTATITPETFPALELAGEIATEQVWSIREKWGSSYGVYARTSQMAGGAATLVIEGAVLQPQTGAAVAAMIDVIARLGSDQIDMRSFVVKRWDLARTFSRRFAEPNQIAGAIAEAAALGWPDDVWDKYPERLAALTRANVRDVVAPCVGKEIVTIVGDIDKVGPQLAAEKIAYTRVD